MLISPYLFEPETAKPNSFERMLADYKTWYLWSEILEVGTAVAYTSVSVVSDNTNYFIVDPSMDNHPCITPEEFIEILTGHEENGMCWGYSWTIKEMAGKWQNLVYLRYGEGDYSVSDYALKIDYDFEKLEIVPKAMIWKSIEEINF